jgi:hypothetical protein
MRAQGETQRADTKNVELESQNLGKRFAARDDDLYLTQRKT